MNWKAGLDRYITLGPPDDGFDSWCEQTTEMFSNEFFENNEDWILESELCNGWFNRLFNSFFNKSPQKAANIIERAHSLYRIKK